MKKFTLAAAAGLALGTAAPAIADDKVSDDPFISTQAHAGAISPLVVVGGVVGGIVLGVVAFSAATDTF